MGGADRDAFQLRAAAGTGAGGAAFDIGALLPGILGKALGVRSGLSASGTTGPGLEFQALLVGCAGRNTAAGAAAGCFRAS